MRFNLAQNTSVDLVNFLYVRKRVDNAAVQKDNYTVERVGDRKYHVTNTVNGKVYKTTPNDCDCPDWYFRSQESNKPCKHMVLVRLTCPPPKVGIVG